MGGQSVPTQTMSVQAYNPNKIDKAKLKMEQEKQALQMAYYKPALEDMLAKRAMFKGVLGGDTGMMRQAVGLPNTANPEQVRAAILRRQGIPSTPVTGVMPKQMAAKGGIMQLRKYAAGGKATSLNSTQKQFVKDMAKLMDSGKELTQAQQDRLNKIETDTGVNVSPYSQVGTQTPGDPAIASAATRLQTGFTAKNPADSNSPNALADVRPPTQENPITPMDALMNKTYGVSPGLDESGNIDPTKPMTYTDPWVQNAMKEYNAMQAPTEWNQAGDIYRSTTSGLQGLTNFTPQNVTASQMGPIANISAQQASAQQASAERATAAQMAAIKDVQAQKLQRYQMEGKVPEVTTKDLEAYQMAGPGSWTEEGVQQKYMSPYMQGVIDISKREAERDYLKQANALNAKAISAGAFGGSRQALERSEAQRNYNQQLQDLQVKGLQQAYESGRSQYGQELSLSQQAALQNLQSKLSTQSQSSQQQLQAMLSNQNIDYQTKVQNLQAMLGVQNQEAQQMLQAALANQQTQFGVGSLNANLANQTALQNAQLGTQASMTNAQLGTQASLANAQNALQASMANQQTQFGVGSLNANLAQQAALANQQAGIAGAGVNLNAYNAQQNAAQGLGSLGNSNANWTQQQFGNAKQLADWSMQQGQGYLDRNTQGNLNIYNASNMPAGAPT